MAIMGKYCKAYLLQDFRQFAGWSEKAENARKKKMEIDGKVQEEIRELTDDAILYLQENYVVTDSLFEDENIIFDDVTPEWMAFCQNTLEFEIPTFEPI